MCEQPAAPCPYREREREKKRRVRLTYRTTSQDIEVEIYSIIIIIHDEKCHEERKKKYKRLSSFNPVFSPYIYVCIVVATAFIFLFFLTLLLLHFILFLWVKNGEEWIIYSSFLSLPFSHIHTRISSRAGMRSPLQSSLDSTHEISFFSRCVGLKFEGEKERISFIFCWVNVSYL